MSETKGHDPLCPVLAEPDPSWCLCGLIAKVRADERERVAAAIEALLPSTHDLYNQGIRDAARVVREEES